MRNSQIHTQNIAYFSPFNLNTIQPYLEGLITSADQISSPLSHTHLPLFPLAYTKILFIYTKILYISWKIIIILLYP